MRPLTPLASIILVLSLAVPAACPRASGADMLSTNVVGGSSGWFSSGVWKTNNGAGVPTGPGVNAPVPGNTYTLVQGPNPAIGNNLAETRTRNPYTNGTPNPVVFPGDSLTLTTNTEIRFKRVASGNVPVVNFPGVGGNPGLILTGGMLNTGDPDVFTVSGLIQASAGAQSYLCPGNNDFASTETTRGLNIPARIIGSGTLCVVQGTTNTPVAIQSVSNSYSGLWLVKAGRLLGAGSGSLGTNSSIVIDPSYLLPVPPLDASSSSAANGPAVLEVNYDLNSSGTLTLVNGGRMRLHQNCAFTGVTIEGSALTPGTHYYSELVASFPTSFDAGGSGAISVQPYGNLPSLGPTITAQPLPQTLYLGRTAHFSVTANANGAPPLTYQWRKNGSNLSDGGNISGSTNAVLTVSIVGSGDTGNYDVVVYNTSGNTSSASAPLSLATPTGEAYEAAVIAANPSAFYQFNETTDTSSGTALAFDFAGGYNGTYGTSVQNGNPVYGIKGPSAESGYPGFLTGNAAAAFQFLNAPARVTLTAPWNLNTNTVTITAWINPLAAPGVSSGLVFCRGGGTVAGLNFSPGTDINGNASLGYTWDNEWETYNWNTGLVPPQNQWSFVALVVTPTNATIHLMNTNGLLSATHQYPHVVQAFGAGSTTLIGDDSAGSGGNRVFNGVIDDVGVFNAALSKDQLMGLFTNASQVAPNYAPAIGLQPTNEVLYAGQTAVFAVTAGGTEPLTYQWQSAVTGSGNFSNLSDGGRVSGSRNSVLTIVNVTDTDSMDYRVIVSGGTLGTATSTVANLSVWPTSPAEHITLIVPGTTTAVLQPGGQDWDTVGDWSDGQAASVSAVMKPGSTYEVLPSGGLNARLRSPSAPTIATFPGDVLTLTGNAVWTNNPGTNGATSELRFKQPTPGGVQGTVIFKKLVMNGGQLDAGADSGNNINTVIIGGEIDVLTNAPFYNDNSADRGFLITAWLTGGPTTSIEYHGYNQGSFQSNYVHNLNIAGNSNTFSGKWNVAMGTLLGTGTNALGTNDIVVGPNGALQTTYDVNNPLGSLFLSGRMYLHQNDTFESLFINGVPLAVGTYTFAQLNASYPTNFPATWTPQIGTETFTNGSGSITVLVQPAPTVTLQPVSLSKYPTETVQFTVAAQGNLPLYYQWRKGGVKLSDTGNISGAGTTNLTIANITAADAGTYDVLITNSVGSATSSPATLTVLATGPALNLTLDYGGTPIVQAQNLDWNTPTNWSDGNPASLTALANPGSTFTVPAGARLRSPSNSVDVTFPGTVLTVAGDGVWESGGITTLAELRFKHANPGTNHFNKLVMNGGQLDNGDNGLIVIAGEMDILANTPIYVDSSAGQDRPYQIDAWLTGNGSIEYHAFDTSFSANLNITGTSNTFNGTWNIVQGCVLGSGPNSLGPNSITVGAGGALETLYDLNSPNADLVLDGQLFLHQNDSFRTVTVGGVALSPGVHNFAALAAAYPANFPATWPQQIGSGFAAGSGTLTVLAGSTVSLEFKVSGSGLQLTWSQGSLLEADEVTGPWTTNSTAVSPFTVSPTEAKKFYRVLVGPQ